MSYSYDRKMNTSSIIDLLELKFAKSIFINSNWVLFNVVGGILNFL